MTRTAVEQDGSGGPKETWEDGATIWASVEPIKGTEYWLQGRTTRVASFLPQVEASVDARIRIRRRNGLSPAELRVRHGRTVYDVLAVIQDVANIETQLMVQARKLDQGEGQEVNA
jgi:head-tail adaptor